METVILVVGAVLVLSLWVMVFLSVRAGGSRSPIGLSEAVASLTARAAAAEARAESLQDLSARLQDTLSKHTSHTEEVKFLRAHVQDLTAKLHEYAEMGFARVDRGAQAAVAFQHGRGPTQANPAIGGLIRDGFTTDPPADLALEPISIPSERPLRPGETRVVPAEPAVPPRRDYSALPPSVGKDVKKLLDEWPKDKTPEMTRQ